MNEQEIEKIFQEEGFYKRYLLRFDIDEGVEDPVTGKKAPHTISWQLDNTTLCEYMVAESEEQIRKELSMTRHQSALSDARADYMKKKHMKPIKFQEDCQNAQAEVANLANALKAFKGKTLSVQQDFYEESMFCILSGDGPIEGESDYDDRCIAGSMHEEVANNVAEVLADASKSVGLVNQLAVGGIDIVNQLLTYSENVDNLTEEAKAKDKLLADREKEIKTLKTKLDKKIASTITASGGGGNVVVADPESFAKVLRALESMSENIELAKQGKEVPGLPVSESHISKELLKFNEMIKRILISVNGKDS